ncbi:MAG: acetyl-CoA carboxylase biotin carboxyl carrier protein subunit [Thermoflexibacter sp.]|jgi:biotin carboxyl carrier protein|nr:acetyl-CoA carboxylase biotin carboxyl carrier protein subunit [Thermoflexibacter sp.]
MLKINTNNTTFEVEHKKEGLFINGEIFDGDIQSLGNNHFHILHQNRSYNVELVKADYSEKSFTLKINGNTYQLGVQDRFDLLLEQLGMGKLNKQKLNDLKAPMPGLILDIMVKEGDTIKKGDNLLILEAMKMENMIKSIGDGTIQSVKVEKGDRVEKNHVLIVFA